MEMDSELLVPKMDIKNTIDLKRVKLQKKYNIKYNQFINLQNPISDNHYGWLLSEMFLLANGNNRKKEILRRNSVPNLSMKELESLYYKCTIALNHYYSEQVERTVFERKIERLLKDSFYKFYNNFWIGNINVDFYIPVFRLAVEVNGSVHHREFKMKKDNYRDKKLMNRMGLFVFEIENDDVGLMLHKLDTLLHDSGAKFNSNTVFNDRKRIYIETIVSHLSFQSFCDYVGFNFENTINELKENLIIA